MVGPHRKGRVLELEALDGVSGRCCGGVDAGGDRAPAGRGGVEGVETCREVFSSDLIYFEPRDAQETKHQQ